MLFAETQLSETHRKQCMGEGSPSSALSYHYSALGDSPLRTRSFWLYRVTSHKGPSLSPSAGSFHAPAWVQRVKSTVNFILGWAQISFWFSSLENRQGPEHSGKTQPKLKHLSWKKLGTVKAPGTSCWEQEQVRNDGKPTSAPPGLCIKETEVMRYPSSTAAFATKKKLLLCSWIKAIRSLVLMHSSMCLVTWLPARVRRFLNCARLSDKCHSISTAPSAHGFLGTHSFLLMCANCPMKLERTSESRNGG